MKVYLNRIDGIDDAIVSMFMSKRSWTREKEEQIRDVCSKVFNPVTGRINGAPVDDVDHFFRWCHKLMSIGKHHITLLKFIDMSITVEGLHRGGQDDWDSHANRFDNRIIRSSTRLATFGTEMSDWYKGKILPTDEAITLLGMSLPDTVERDGITYVRSVNGYIAEPLADNNDVKRGLYMLSIPSNFIFRINLTEWCHVYKERNIVSGANPEVKEVCEAIADAIELKTGGLFSRELFNEVKN